MKKIALAISLVFILSSCGGPTLSSESNEIESPESSVNESTPESSSLEESSIEEPFVENELSTKNGLTFKFNARGARIDKVEWNGKQIAKDGFIAGRCANRIANASFELNGKTYNLDRNNGKHHLHGGSRGFGEINWTKVSQTASKIEYTLHSNDGDMGYPGNLDISVTYTLSQEGKMDIEYRAKSDADTILNPINHLYMSLNGNNSAQNHSLWIDADSYTEKDRELIPTGNILPVDNTKYDFRGEGGSFNPGNNYDDNYVLNGEGYRSVATLRGNISGMMVTVYTDRPGLQLYNTNSHICLETQLYPDAIHHDNFPSPILLANQDFYSKTSYWFNPTL